MNSGDIVNEILDIAQNSSKMPGFGSKVLADVDRLEAVASRLSQSITSDNLAQLIVQDAQRKAFRMVEQAESDSEARRSGADRYALEVLHSLEESMASWISQVRTGLDSLQDNSGN